MQSVGFKEWAIVCEALARGEQSVILRKGGIAEDSEGFAFHHREFFLFPTYFHEQLEKVRVTHRTLPLSRDGEIEIRCFAKVEWMKVITSWEAAEALEPLHIIRREVVRERFFYGDTPGLHVAFVRVFALERPWVLPEVNLYRGCRSWVTLPDPPSFVKPVPSFTVPLSS